MPRAKKVATSSRTKNGSARKSAREASVPADIRDAVSRLKREAIVAAAVELFYKQGYARTTLDEVAAAMNVTKPFIYAHFASKSELLAEICMRGTLVSNEVLERAVAQRGTPAEKLADITRDFVLAVLGYQAHGVIYNREEKELDSADREAINRLRRRFDHRLVAVIEEGVASGAFAVDDAQMAALAIIGMVAWSQMWFRANGRLTKEAVAERMSGLVLAMVRAKPARVK